MYSKVVSSILSRAHTDAAEEEFNTVTHCNTQPPPYFEGHSLFLEPLSRSQGEGVTIVRFQRNTDVLILTGPRLRDLVEIFAFLHRNNLTLRRPKMQDFIAGEDGRLLMARPWRLRHDSDGALLAKAQKGMRKILWPSGLSQLDRDLLKHFYAGTSPNSLPRHPLFWSVDRAKWFILDLAGSRRCLRKNTAKLLPNWKKLVRSGSLSVALKHQVKFYRKKNRRFTFDGTSLMDLIVFLSNLIRHFEEHKQAGLGLESSDDCFEIVEAEFGLIQRAWDAFNLDASAMLRKYKL